jgi:serine/threonine protein kinase
MYPGDRIGHVRVDGPLAEGGMGAVYAGFDEKLQRPVALKAIRGDRLDAAARARLLTEARLLSQLDHPNVCRIHGYLESGGEEDFLVLELIRGRTLRAVLRQGLAPGERLAVAEGVARALEATHEKGIVHRDLKPANVMCTEDGQVKVLDFGLARPDGRLDGRFDEIDESDEEAAPVGTPSSMSPEQARGEPATAASDACALGLLLQELFTGRPAFEPGLPEPLLLVKAADGDTLPVRGIDPDLAALIRGLKAQVPEARPTAAAAAERLAWIRGKPRRRRLRLLTAAVTLAFVLGGVKYTLDLQEARNAAEQEAARAAAAARFLEDLSNHPAVADVLDKLARAKATKSRLNEAEAILQRSPARTALERGQLDKP